MEIIVHNEEKYVEIITNGFMDKDRSMAMAETIKESLKKNHMTRVLIDHRKVTGVSGDIFDIYERPKIFKLIGVILGIKVAELINPDHLEHFRFLETVCLNRGFKFSIFYDRDDALKWLIGH